MCHCIALHRAAIDKRITASFPIAGSTPCSMRNPVGLVSGQNWTGDDDEDFEQSCRPNMPSTTPNPSGDNQPGRAAFAVCNYTCQYLLAGLEPGRSQVQILHEYDTCCFSPHNRHDGMLQYESNIRRELMGGDRKVSNTRISKSPGPVVARRISVIVCRIMLD